jgi:hypothetical protein
VSFILSFFFPECLHCRYIYFHCSSNLEPCALNSEFQHFVPRFNIIKLPSFTDTTERFGVEKRPKEEKKRKKKGVTLWITPNVLFKYNSEIWGGSLQNTKSMNTTTTTTTSRTKNMDKGQKKEYNINLIQVSSFNRRLISCTALAPLATVNQQHPPALTMQQDGDGVCTRKTLSPFYSYPLANHNDWLDTNNPR